ncbi:MAG TPA: RDD family protein [Solimonas sp.]
MSDLSLPAPLWRRLAAATYDGLLLIALWMVALLLDVLLRDLLSLEREWHALRAYVFLIGYGFFAWFWTHGGQTLGMRAWRLYVQRRDGTPPGWISAMARYATMLLVWGIALTPLLLRLPRLSQWPLASTLSAAAVVATIAMLLAWRLDPQRRAPQDWFSDSAIVLRTRTD